MCDCEVHTSTPPPSPLPLFLTLLDRKLGAKSPPATGPWHENHTHNPLMVSPQSQPMKWSRSAKRVQWVSDLLHDSNIYAIHQQQQLAEGKYRAGIVYSHPSPFQPPLPFHQPLLTPPPLSAVAVAPIQIQVLVRCAPPLHLPLNNRCFSGILDYYVCMKNIYSPISTRFWPDTLHLFHLSAPVGWHRGGDKTESIKCFNRGQSFLAVWWLGSSHTP